MNENTFKILREKGFADTQSGTSALTFPLHDVAINDHRWNGHFQFRWPDDPTDATQFTFSIEDVDAISTVAFYHIDHRLVLDKKNFSWFLEAILAVKETHDTNPELPAKWQKVAETDSFVANLFAATIPFASNAEFFNNLSNICTQIGDAQVWLSATRNPTVPTEARNTFYEQLAAKTNFATTIAPYVTHPTLPIPEKFLVSAIIEDTEQSSFVLISLVGALSSKSAVIDTFKVLHSKGVVTGPLAIAYAKHPALSDDIAALLLGTNIKFVFEELAKNKNISSQIRTLAYVTSSQH